MTERIPLGEKEDLHQEFKSRDALKKPESIAREVVAMLNAKGGVVWVGLKDEDDRAAAVEPVSNADWERRRLRDYLVDTIEPSPASGEVSVETVPVETGGEILRIKAARPMQRQFYAHLREGGRWFLVRVSDRTRPMTREELFSGTGKEADTARKHSMDSLLEERKRIQNEGGERLWLALRPIREDAEIDLHNRLLREYLVDPTLTDNRHSGWNFCSFEEFPALRREKLVTAGGDPRVVEIRRNALLSFSLPLEALYWKGEASEIWPLALWEYPISAFRMAREIYTKLLDPPADQFVADLALIGLHGWKLRSGSPASGYFSLRPKKFLEADDFLLEKPLVFSQEEITGQPDRCGYRLLERVYEAFGYSREAIPPEFDQKAGRLVFPERW